jgi:hypothetical protein
MPNISDIGIPYPSDRDGVVATTGPSTQTAPGERELFDHSNLWFSADALETYLDGSSAPLVSNTDLHVYRVKILPADVGVQSTNGRVSVSFRRPRVWATGGEMSVRIWYTGTAQAAVVMKMELLIFGYQSLVGSLTPSVDYSFDMSPPASSSKITVCRTPEGVVDGRLNLVREHEFVTVQLIRKTYDATSTDTYDYDLELLGIECIYVDPTTSPGTPPGYLMMP